MFLRPTNPNHDMIYFKTMVTEVERSLENIDGKYPSVSYNLTGMAKMMEEQQAMLNIKIIITSAIAFILVLILFIISYRKIMSPIIASVPVVIGIVWTLAINQLVIGRLNLITSIFAANLLGLGILLFLGVLFYLLASLLVLPILLDKVTIKESSNLEGLSE